MSSPLIRAIGIIALAATISAGSARAQGTGPGPDLKLLADAKDSFNSPDNTRVVEQYSRDSGAGGVVYEFWIFDKDRKNAFHLNPGEDDELAGYPAGFRFTPDGRWLVRMQATAADFATLLLYKRDGDRFLPATSKPLGELAWDYFFTQRAAKGMPRDPDELNHKRADLLKGLEESYAWLGVKWPDSRYLVIALRFDTQGNDRPTPWIEGWRCVYDTQTGRFSVPAAFAAHNARARMMPKSEPRRRG